MYKARIVLRGQFMKAGLDYNDAFSPVAKPTTIRAVLALAVKKVVDLFSGDIETAFLTPDIDTARFMATMTAKLMSEASPRGK